MNTAYRIYLGARNTESRTFSPREIEAVETILNEHFHGWTTAQAVGSWQGATEEAMVITVTTRAARQGPESARAAIENCATRLKDQLGQESVMLETGGGVSFL
jgi:hypothetical protein